MTSVWVGLLIGFALGSFLWWPVFILAYRRVIRRKMAEIEYIKQAHRSVIADLLYRMNHEGMIPPGSSADGMTLVISLVIKACISQLKDLYRKQDWNTMEVISQLQMIAIRELDYLHETLSKFLQKKRDFMRDFENHTKP